MSPPGKEGVSRNEDGTVHTFFLVEESSVWACFWVIWAGQGLDW